jgi:hypothetical protein
MLVFALSRFAACASVLFTDENFSALVRPPSADAAKPVLIELFHLECDHCQEFAPTWRQFTASVTAKKSSPTAQISYQSSRRLCRHFRVSEWPFLLWFDPPKLRDGPLHRRTHRRSHPRIRSLGSHRGVETGSFEITLRCEQHFLHFKCYNKSHFSKSDKFSLFAEKIFPKSETTFFDRLF